MADIVHGYLCASAVLDVTTTFDALAVSFGTIHRPDAYARYLTTGSTGFAEEREAEEAKTKDDETPETEESSETEQQDVLAGIPRVDGSF